MFIYTIREHITTKLYIYIIVSHTGDREERCYMTGRLDGTAKYYYSSGAVETRIYENGVLQVRYN